MCYATMVRNCTNTRVKELILEILNVLLVFLSSVRERKWQILREVESMNLICSERKQK